MVVVSKYYTFKTTVFFMNNVGIPLIGFLDEYPLEPNMLYFNTFGYGPFCHNSENSDVTWLIIFH